MKNNFLFGALIGAVTMILVGFTVAETTTIFKPAAPEVVSSKFCTTNVEIVAAIKYYADRKYSIDVYPFNAGLLIVGKKY